MLDFDSYRDSDELVKEEKSGAARCLSRVWSSPFTRYALPSFGLGLLVLVLVYFGLRVWAPQDATKSQFTCHLQPSYHVLCLSGVQVDMNKCLEIGCCWRDDIGVCYHTYPSRYGYKVDEIHDGADKEGTISPTRKISPAGIPMRQQLGFSVHQVNDYRVRIALTKNAVKSRAKRDIPAGRQSNKLADFASLFNFLPRDDNSRFSTFSLATGKQSTSVDVVVQESHFSVTLARPTTSSLLASTARGPLIVTDDYWEWTLYFTSATVYGLDRLELNGTSGTVYSSENATTRPTFLAIDEQGNGVGCVVDYDGPLEVQVLDGSNLVILRGLYFPDELGIELVTGPTPLQAIQQLSRRTSTSAPLLQKLQHGLHICPEARNRETAGKDALNSLKDSIAKMESLSAPWDTHCLYRGLSPAIEHDAEDRQSMLELVSEARKLLGDAGKSFAAHLTPMLLDRANGELRGRLKDASCLLRNDSSSSVYTGLYDDQYVVYPDWAADRETRKLTRDDLIKYGREISTDFIVLRDAWPRDNTDDDEATATAKTSLTEKRFPYLPEELRRAMSRGTVPWNVDGDHYTRHNKYASDFRAFVESHAAVVEVEGQECNNERVEANWAALKKMLEVGVAAAMQGRVPTAMYVCGAEDPERMLDDELCIRWYGLAVPWPRILALPDKSPGSKRLSRTAGLQAAKLLRLRASLATYQHTVLASHAETAAPIFATASVYYPGEERPGNVSIGSQFMWGDSILVGLVVLQRRAHVRMWLPGTAAWRGLQGGDVFQPTGNDTHSLSAAISEVIMLVRPGRVVPVHKEESVAAVKSTSEAMRRNLRLLTNLFCTERVSCQAEGSIYYGDDDSGAFLLIEVLKKASYPGRAFLTLKNVRNAQAAVGCGSATSPTSRLQATVIESLELLGNDTMTINRDLCVVASDNVTVICEQQEDRSFKCS